MAVRLTEGAISMVSSPEWKQSDLKPVLQVLDVRCVRTQNSTGEEKYRLVVSDGSFRQQAMLASQRNELVRSLQLQKGSIVQLTEFVSSRVRDRVIIIITNLDVILESCDIIGDAKPYTIIPGSDPPAQSFNQPSTTMSNAQTFTGGSRPNIPANSPNYPPQHEYGSGLNSYGNRVNSPNYPSQQQYNAGQHSYGNPATNNSDSGRYNFANSNAPSMNIRPDSATTISRPPATAYTRPVQSNYNQPPPMYMNRGPTAKNDPPPRTIPIAALNPYQGRWTIKARVTAKAELRNYSNAKGDGKVFSFDLLDSDGGEIRCTCFNAVADQFYDQLEAGKIYYISKGSVKPAQKAFNHLKNDHEITLDTTSTIQPCVEDDSSIPQQQYHFRPIAEIEGLDINTILDIIGVVSSITPATTIHTKAGNETQKRSLQLKDMSGRSVDFTLWGKLCNTDGQTLQNMCDSGVFPIVAVKSARVGEFNGKNLSTISTSQLSIEPDFPEARTLKTWFDNIGKNAPSISLSRESIAKTDVRKTISQIKDEKLGTSEKPDWISMSATIWFLKTDSFCYTACNIMIGDRQCNKKVVNNGDGKWRCDRCDQTIDQCDYRYILQLQLQDHTGLTWVTAFQEGGEDIIGISCKELYSIKYEDQDEERFTEIMRSVVHSKYIFKLKVKEESYNDEPRVKSTVVKAERIKAASETTVLLDLLKKDVTNPVGVKQEIPVFGSRVDPNSYVGSGIGSSVSQQSALPIPANQMGNYGNQYGGSRLNSSCNSCGGVGHDSMSCPSVVNAQGYSVTPGGGRFNSVPAGGGNSATAGECFKCHQTGHWARDCPGVSNNVSLGYGSDSVPAGGGNSVTAGECFKCHQPGHWARDCPGVSNNVSSGYGSGNVGPGRYGSASGQYVGGY